jgi:hypothetical protein
LDTRLAAWLKQLTDFLEIGWPVRLANRLNHFNGANRVIGAILNVTVVLQTQIGILCFAVPLHPRIGKCQLLGRQGHASNFGTKINRGHFGQCAPTTANF